MPEPANTTNSPQDSLRSESGASLFVDTPVLAPAPAISDPSPNIVDLHRVESMVQERMTNMERQMAAQLEAWNTQEAVLLQQIVTLQAELVSARRSAGDISPPTPAIVPSSNPQDSFMADEIAPSSTTDIQPGQPDGTNSRKRRRTAGSEPNSGVTLRRQPGPARIVTRSAARRQTTRRQTAPVDAHSIRGAASSLNVSLNATPSQPVPTTQPAPIPPSQLASVPIPQPAPPPTPRPTPTPAPQPAQTPLYTFSAAALEAAPMPKSLKKRNVVKKAAEIYRFLPREMPSDLGGLQKSMALHIRILWGLLDANEVPRDPADKIVSDFNMRFSNETQLYASQHSGRELIPRHLIQIGTAMSAVRGRIANQARLVEEHMLGYIQACLAKFGLPFWCPDLRQSAYSLYNAACRIVALDTFRQALVSHTYLHLNPNTVYATNISILIRLFDHFTFHYMKSRYQREGRHPGTVSRRLRNNPQYVARIRLADARLHFLVENNYPQRYRDLIQPKATSDDEYDPGREAWVIKRRPERSAKANTFFRILDRKRKQAAQLENPRRWRERVRIEASPDEPADTQFHSLPEGMPIDYYGPEFFNQLQPKTRNRIAVRKVAFLPNVNRSLTWGPDERISDDAFSQKYGEDVFNQYEMVTDADMADYDGSDADDEWMADDDDTMADAATPRSSRSRSQAVNLDAINVSRNTLSAHLSGSSSSFSVSYDNFSQPEEVSTPRALSTQFSGSASHFSEDHFSDNPFPADFAISQIASDPL